MITTEILINAPIERVWNAISNKDEMKLWYFDLPKFEATVGTTFEFSGGPSPEKQFLHHCEILQVIPLKKLKHTWGYVGYNGSSVVTFELFDHQNKTLVQLTHKGLETFPADAPEFAIPNFVAGWNHIIKTSLKEYLEK